MDWNWRTIDPLNILASEVGLSAGRGRGGGVEGLQMRC